MKRFAVIGLGRFGKKLAIALSMSGAEVIAIDKDRTIIEDIVDLIPDIWLDNEKEFSNPEQHRQAYINYLLNRLASSKLFVKEAEHARANLL